MADPDISVVIPVYENAAGLRKCLRALANQHMAGDRFEVVVVDDGSRTPIAEQVMRDRDAGVNVLFLRTARGGPAAARNAGVQAARGGLVVFTDHDCVPERTWLNHLAEAHVQHPRALLGGQVVNGLPDNRYSTAHEVLAACVRRWFSKRGPAFFSTNNLAVSRELFLKSGGFDSGFSFAHEDRDLAARWVETGGHLQPVPNAVVLHEHWHSLASFCRQHFRYGQGAVDFRQARRRRGATQGRFEGVQFYTALLKEPWLHMKGVDALGCSALIALAQLAYGAGYYHRLLRGS